MKVGLPWLPPPSSSFLSGVVVPLFHVRRVILMYVLLYTKFHPMTIVISIVIIDRPPP